MQVHQDSPEREASVIFFAQKASKAKCVHSYFPLLVIYTVLKTTDSGPVSKSAFSIMQPPIQSCMEENLFSMAPFLDES